MPERTPTTLRFSGKRPTLGLLTNGFWHTLSFELWCGVRDVALESDVNLICFPGNEIGSTVKQEVSPSSANVLYDLVSSERLDGLLVWTGALGNFISEQALQEFCYKFKLLPIICIGRKIEGLPYVDTDVIQGARGVVDHLIEAHGYRRILYIRGPAGHAGCEMRYQAYLDALKAHDIPFDPDLVTPAMDGWNDIEVQYRPYLDGQAKYSVQVDAIPPEQWPVSDVDEDSTELLYVLRKRHLVPGRDFEAFVGATDVITALAIRRLQVIGIHVPRDVGAAGGDGSREANHVLQMRLTTSGLVLYEQGRRATKLMISHWQGTPLDSEVIIPGRYVINQSCGCLSEAIQQANSHLFDTSSPPDVERIVQALRASVKSVQKFLPPKLCLKSARP